MVELAAASLHMPSLRPYRSHKAPACSSCRRRKSRCTVDIAGRACLVCRLNRTACDFSGIEDEHRQQGEDFQVTLGERQQSLSRLS